MKGPVLPAVLIGTPLFTATRFAMSSIRPSIETQNLVLSLIAYLLDVSEPNGFDWLFVVRVRGPVAYDLEYGLDCTVDGVGLAALVVGGAELFRRGSHDEVLRPRQEAAPDGGLPVGRKAYDAVEFKAHHDAVEVAYDLDGMFQDLFFREFHDFIPFTCFHIQYIFYILQSQA